MLSAGNFLGWSRSLGWVEGMSAKTFSYLTPKEMRALAPTPSVQGSPTSEEAARAMPDSVRRVQKQKILDAITAAGIDGLTDDAGERITRIAGDTYRPRRGELFREQKIRKTGRTRLTQSHREAEVWVARLNH